MLGVDIADARKRLAFIKGQTASSSLISRATGARELTDIATQAPAATLAITGKLLGRALLGAGRRAPIANCAITNVPGPSDALYLAGARMTYFSAIMPINDGLGLVFAVTSYDGRDHRFAHLVPRADAGSGGLCPVPARFLPGVPRAGAPARAGQCSGPAQG